MSLATSQGFSHPHFIVIKKIWLGLLEGQLDNRWLQLNFQIHLSCSWDALAAKEEVFNI